MSAEPTREELVAWAHQRANELHEMDLDDAATRAAQVGVMLEADAKALGEKDAEIARLNAVVSAHVAARNVLAGDINMTAVKRSAELEALARMVASINKGPNVPVWYDDVIAAIKVAESLLHSEGTK